MTEQEKSDIRQQFHKLADMQADSMINAIEVVDKQLPKDITAEQRTAVINNLVQQSAGAVNESIKQLAEQMKKTKPEVKNG